MASQVEDLTVNYTEDGVQVTKELDKVILSRGAWATVLFRYQDWDAAKNEYGPEKYTLRRYRKRGGEFSQQSKFNISNKEQAKQIIDALRQWVD